MQGDVLDFQSVHAPECLIGIVDGDILQFQVVHLAEELRAVDDAVLHRHVVAVPDGRAALWREVAARDETAVDMPPGILAIELAVVTLQIVAALDARLTVGDGYILQYSVVSAEQRTLTTETQIVYSIHKLLNLRGCLRICVIAYKVTKIMPNTETQPQGTIGKKQIRLENKE